jgi:hypothetical protein
LKHKFRFMGNNNNNDNNNENQRSANDEGSIDDASVDSLSLPSDVSSDREDYPYELLIAEANQHAEMAQQQRQLAKNRQQTALDEAHLPHDSRRFVFCCSHASLYVKALTIFFFFSYCIICDYAQNLELPHFGAGQPQDIYYFSAITVNIFGVTDVTKKPMTMLAFGYTEDQGGKGGNNVASLILKALRELGWIKQDGSTGKQLTIILDNCGGQNKNNFVLRLAPWLVECKLFKKVEIIFYVRGHTKNACDRLFNQLKLRYHRHQTYTMRQLVDLLNTSLNITFKETSAEDFMDYGAMLDKFYKKFPAGTIQQNHIFWVEDSNATKIYTKRSDEADVEEIDIKAQLKMEIDSRNCKTTASLRFQPLVLEKLSRWRCIPSFASSSQRNFGTKYAQGLLSRFWKILKKQGVKRPKPGVKRPKLMAEGGEGDEGWERGIFCGCWQP